MLICLHKILKIASDSCHCESNEMTMVHVDEEMLYQLQYSLGYRHVMYELGITLNHTVILYEKWLNNRAFIISTQLVLRQLRKVQQLQSCAYFERLVLFLLVWNIIETFLSDCCQFSTQLTRNTTNKLSPLDLDQQFDL